MIAARRDTRVGLAALWIPIFAGPVLWTLSDIVLYPVAARGCFTGFPPGRIAPDPTGARWFAGVWMMVSLVLALLALALAVRSFRRVHEGNGNTDAARARVRFMSYAGLIVSAVFLYAILINGLGIAFSGSPCG